MFPGIIGKKLGMTQVVLGDGEVVGVTAIKAGPAVVTQIRNRDKDGYNAVQLGLIEDEGKKVRLTSPEKGHLKKAGVENIRYLHEFRTDDIGSIKEAERVDVSFLKAGDLVNVTGISKGKGFAGVVKRHHFAGGPKTHGQSDRHRAPGSIGATTFPGRVLKGKRMAGHMGSRRVTVRNLKVIQADPERNLLLLQGAVPGANGGIVFIEKVS
jgi:large subunit ribosomal protein L3